MLSLSSGLKREYPQAGLSATDSLRGRSNCDIEIDGLHSPQHIARLAMVVKFSSAAIEWWIYENTILLKLFLKLLCGTRDASNSLPNEIPEIHVLS